LDVIELNTELLPLVPGGHGPFGAPVLPLPPPPTVTVIGEPAETEKLDEAL
jgi:hypothetical protein